MMARLERLCVPAWTTRSYFFGGGENLPAFPKRVGDRLLEIYVLAGLHRPDRLKRVVVIRRGDDDGVDLIAEFFEHVAKVDEGLRRGTIRCGGAGNRDGAGENLGVDVAERGDADAGKLGETGDEVATADVEADEGDADVRIGAGDLGIGAGGNSDARGGERGGFEKGAAGEHGRVVGANLNCHREGREAFCWPQNGDPSGLLRRPADAGLLAMTVGISEGGVLVGRGIEPLFSW